MDEESPRQAMLWAMAHPLRLRLLQVVLAILR
jgi:hypothetical protein